MTLPTLKPKRLLNFERYINGKVDNWFLAQAIINAYINYPRYKTIIINFRVILTK